MHLIPLHIRMRSFLVMVLALAGLPMTGEELSTGLEAYLAAQRDAAAHAAHREAQRPAKARSSAVLVGKALGTPGAIAIASVTLVAPSNAAAVPCFAKVELLVDIPTLAATKPYDPSPASGGLDLEAHFAGPDGSRIVKGFWDGSTWRIRFAPTTVGAWSYSVSAYDSSGSATWSGGSFTCVPSTNPGFLRLRNDSFEFSGTNRPFVGIGHNIGWQMQVEHPAISGETPATSSYGTVPATTLLTADRSMAANGENLLVFWLSAPWELPNGSYPHRAQIEAASTGLGVYNQAPCQYVDQLLEKAQAAGVYLMPAIWPHDAVRGSASPLGVANWNGNAYSTVCTASEFTTTTTTGGDDTPQWIAQKNFFRYLTARFGYSTALAGWIGVEGLDQTDAWVVSSPRARAWCQSVEAWFVQNDSFRNNGSGYPITFNNMGTVVNETSLWSHNNWSYTNSSLSVAPVLAQQIMQYSSRTRYINEFGGQVAFQPRFLHNAAWACMAAGANMTPMAWGDGQSFRRLSDGATGQAMQTHLRYLSQFLSHVPWAGYYATSSLMINTSPHIGWYTHISDRGFGWLFRNDWNALGSHSLTLSANAGTYTIWWFDPNNDCATPFATTTETVSGSASLNPFTLTLPAAATGMQDVAWHYQQHPTVTASLHHDLLGGIAESILLDGAPSYNFMMEAVITSLPANVRLYRTSDGVTPGEEITSVPAVIGNPSLRVIAVSDNVAGTRTFDFHLTEVGTSSVPATMTLTLTRNLAPLADSTLTTISENTTHNLTLTGHDPEAFPVTFSVLSLPTHGMLSGTAPNLTYTPNTNYHGDDSFTFVVNDGVLTSAVATITLHVQHSDTTHDPSPTANAQTLIIDKNTATSFSLTGSDPEAQPITFQVVTSPTHGTLTGTAPDLTYTPALNFHGTDHFTFTVNDGIQNSATATVTIRVGRSDESRKCGIGGGSVAFLFLMAFLLIHLRRRLM